MEKKKFYKEIFLNKKNIKKYFWKQEVIFSTKGLFLEQKVIFFRTNRLFLEQIG